MFVDVVIANFNLTLDELKLIAKYKNVEDHKNMSKNELEHKLYKLRKIAFEVKFKNTKPR